MEERNKQILERVCRILENTNLEYTPHVVTQSLADIIRLLTGLQVGGSED